MSTSIPTDIDALKNRIRATWTAGDFGVIAKMVEEANEEVVAHLNLQPGVKVLDVACGTGNSAIPAARRGADVTGIDIAPNLLEQARARAQQAGVPARFQEGDAEEIAFPDASFDVVISIYGAMFAPRPERVAAEFKRVCRSGGRIVMGNWTPDSFAGASFKLTARYIPPSPGMAPPVLWGDEATVRQRFGEGLSDLNLRKRIATMKLPLSVPEAFDHYSRYFGPTIRTLEALDAEGKKGFRRDFEALLTAHNRATDGTVRVESEFLEVVATLA